MLTNRLDFYNSEKWKKVKRLAIERATGKDGFVYDELNGDRIILKGDIIAHHVIELTDENVDDYSISLNLENIKVVSFAHHNQLHNRFGGTNTKSVIWVYGMDVESCNAFVESHATASDLICSVDRLRHACCFSDERNKATDRAVFILRDALLDAFYTRAGHWITGWIVSKEIDNRMASKLSAELVCID